jgi:hypothetical protein
LATGLTQLEDVLSVDPVQMLSQRDRADGVVIQSVELSGFTVAHIEVLASNLEVQTAAQQVFGRCSEELYERGEGQFFFCGRWR